MKKAKPCGKNIKSTLHTTSNYSNVSFWEWEKELSDNGHLSINTIVDWGKLDNEGLLPPDKQALLLSSSEILLTEITPVVEEFREALSQLWDRFEDRTNDVIHRRKTLLIECFADQEVSPLIRLVEVDIDRLKADKDYLLINERKLVLSFWQNILKSIEGWRNIYPIKDADFRKLKESIMNLIHGYQDTLPETKRGRKQKTNSETPLVVARYLYEECLKFILKSYPDLLINEGTSKGSRFHNLDFESPDFERMLRGFFIRYAPTFLASHQIEKILKSLKKLPRPKPRTIRTLVEKVVSEKYNISETSFKRLNSRNRA